MFKMIEAYKIKPIFVFDSKPPKLKENCKKKRAKTNFQIPDNFVLNTIEMIKKYKIILAFSCAVKRGWSG
jgi:5'-3' exonuclease